MATAQRFINAQRAHSSRRSDNRYAHIFSFPYNTLVHDQNRPPLARPTNIAGPNPYVVTTMRRAAPRKPKITNSPLGLVFGNLTK